MLRQALELPDEEKNVLGLIKDLGIGVYKARQLVTILQTFREPGFETPTIRIRSIISDGYGEYTPFDEREIPRAAPSAPRPSTARAHTEPRPRARTSTSKSPLEEYEERFEDERPSRARAAIDEREEEPPKSRRKKAAEDKPEEEAPSDLAGRRCLFHGGIAVQRCAKCKAVLCRECVRSSDRCPRCNAPLKEGVGKAEKGTSKERAREAEPEEEGEEEQEEVEKKPRRKPEQRAEDLNRL
jgi:hypothetical protein